MIFCARSQEQVEENNTLISLCGSALGYINEDDTVAMRSKVC